MWEVKRVKCKDCSKSFTSIDDMKRHRSAKHKDLLSKEYLLKKQIQLQSKIEEQKVNLFKSISQFNKNESTEMAKCMCRGNCRINHSKMRWVKFNCDLFFEKCPCFF